MLSFPTLATCGKHLAGFDPIRDPAGALQCFNHVRKSVAHSPELLAMFDHAVGCLRSSERSVKTETYRHV